MWIHFVIDSHFKSKKYYFQFDLTSQVFKNKINDGKDLEGWNKLKPFSKESAKSTLSVKWC